MLDGDEPYAAALWQAMAEMGWLGAAIPEQYGGAGLGYEGLCVLAEELGRAVGAGAVRLVRLSRHRGDAARRHRCAEAAPICRNWRTARLIGCFALAEGTGNPDPARVRAARRPAAG